VGEALMENPTLLKKTELIKVMAMVPPKGTAKDVMAMTEAISFGKNPMPWRLPGINRRPVPAPVKAIMKAMVVGWP